MHRIYSALIDIVAAAIFIVPLLALYGKISLRSLKQTLIYIVFAFYLVAVLSLVGFPSVLSLNLDFTINIIPFADMISDFVNACLNVLLFVPLGFLLPMLWKKYKAIKNTMLFAMCMTIAIEISQIFTFRTTDINDIITNMVGTLGGYFIAKRITKNFTQHPELNAENKDLYRGTEKSRPRRIRHGRVAVRFGDLRAGCKSPAERITVAKRADVPCHFSGAEHRQDRAGTGNQRVSGGQHCPEAQL